MTSFFEKIFTRYPIKTRRTLELLPGMLVWTIVLSPIWGSLFLPTATAYFILFFDMYWLYKSISLIILTSLAAKKVKAAEEKNWYIKAKKLKDFDKVHHVLVIPNFGESAAKVGTTLEALTRQSLPKKYIHIILAMEEREHEAKERAEILLKRFKGKFGSLFVTFHPDVEGEVKGKSSNEAYAGRVAYKKLFVDGKLDLDYATVSSVDADSIFHKEHFAFLSHAFLKSPERHYRFWQSAVVYYNNIWKVPSPIRIISFFGSLWRTALLIQKDRLTTHATYSLSFKLLKKIGYWDVDVIPEDYRIFFKAFFKTKGRVTVDPIFLRTSMDAAHSTTYMKSLKNKYSQERRWSWGVSDNPLFIKWWFTVPGVPFYKKTVLTFNVFLDHILWPTNWFIITVAANIMAFLNPVFSRTSLGFQLPQLAGFILSFCTLALLGMMYLEYKIRPANQNLSLSRKILFPFEFLLMPLVGFFLSALPALISHTQLMFNKRLEYKVTEKV